MSVCFYILIYVCHALCELLGTCLSFKDFHPFTALSKIMGETQKVKTPVPMAT